MSGLSLETRVKFEVRSFNRFEAISIYFSLRPQALQNELVPLNYYRCLHLVRPLLVNPPQ